MSRLGTEVDQWQRLQIFRQRYEIEDRLSAVISLEKSISRRQLRSAGLKRTLGQLQEQIVEIRAELAAVESEIEGSRQAGALLIEEVLDQVQIDMGEGWSPTPVLGYRVWRIEDDRIMGNQVHWETPTLEGRCLREIPGEDIPHATHRCGPPACGIYAIKNLEMFPPGIAQGEMHNSVVGLVAMSGKVVEHEDGYRSQVATAVALSANDGRRRLLTTDTKEIEDFFSDPPGRLARAERVDAEAQNPTREFLESLIAKEDTWT